VVAPGRALTVADFLCSISTPNAWPTSRRNHPLPDGNKRVAYLAMRELLARSGYEWIRPDDDETAEMVERLAASDVSEEDFAAWVAEHVA
jgi:prophage maintenance system killer protein